MNDDELVHDMYSCLNLIINELHSIGLMKLCGHHEEDHLRATTKEICKHHHHPSQHGGLEQHDPGHSHWQVSGI